MTDISAANMKKLKWPDSSHISRGAFSVVRKLRKAGYEAFVAGGAVRDALLKKKIVEIDIATSATPAQVKKLFQKVIPTGEKHGTLTVRANKVNYEVTTFRSEGKYLDSRRPNRVRFIKSAKEDARRRDFTINALFYDPVTRDVIDYVGGLGDLKKKKINMVGVDEKRIGEDALRMMRAVRFAAVLHFDLSHETLRAIKKKTNLIKKISAERIKYELDRIMLSDRPALGIGLLDVVGLLKLILPEVVAMKRVKQPKNQHSEGDVYAHTLLSLEKFDSQFDLATRYAVLFHDVGKPGTVKKRNGRLTYYEHQKIGEEIVHEIGKRLKFSRAEVDKITWLVRNHMVPFDFAKMKLSTRRKWGLNPYFKDLLKLYVADASSSLPPSGRVNRNPRGYREGLKIIKEISTKPKLRQPLLSGNEVMKELRISSGPLVGKVLKLVEEKKLAGKLKTKTAAKKFLRKINLKK